MEDRDTTVRSRALGRKLRAAMAAQGMNASAVARITGWSPTKISRLLSGKRGGDPTEVVSLLALFGVFGAKQAEIVALCAELTRPGMVEQYGARLPEQLRTLIEHEDLAEQIHDFHPTVVTGMLETEDYARALLSGIGTLPADEIEDRVRARMERQEIFGRQPRPSFRFFVHEAALRLPVGDARVMAEQLHHLSTLSARSYVSLRVVPMAAGAHAGIAGAFELMEFRDFGPVVHVDSQTVSIFLEAPTEVATYREVLAALATQALDEEQSRDLVASLAASLYG